MQGVWCMVQGVGCRVQVPHSCENKAISAPSWAWAWALAELGNNCEHLCQDLTAGKTKQTYFNRKGVYVYVNAPSIHFVHYEMRDLI